MKKSAKKPRKLSKTYLENAALHYLGRYASTAANLRRVMRRKIQRSAKAHEQNPDEFIAIVEDMITRYIRSGLINDESFARARVDSLRRNGASRKSIAVKLQIKGVERAMVETVAKGTEEDEVAAAHVFARKKQLGPHRKKKVQDARKEHAKDIAKMARAGYGYDVIRAVLKSSNKDYSDYPH
jgi:regulatory protein